MVSGEELETGKIIKKHCNLKIAFKYLSVWFKDRNLFRNTDLSFQICITLSYLSQELLQNRSNLDLKYSSETVKFQALEVVQKGSDITKWSIQNIQASY